MFVTLALWCFVQHYASRASPFKEAEIGGEALFVVAPSRASSSCTSPAADLSLSTFTTSFEGSPSLVDREANNTQTGCHHVRRDDLSMALRPLQAAHQSYDSLLPGLWRALDHGTGYPLQAWTTFTREDGPSTWMGMGTMVGMGSKRQRPQRRQRTCSLTSPKEPIPATQTVPKRKELSKGKSDDSSGSAAQTFPSLPVSPFAAQPTYVTPPFTAPWTVEKSLDQPSANQELISAVRKAYPDSTGMPPELKDILDRTENSEMKRITSDLHKSTAALGRATRQLQELQDSKAQHRAKWLQHLTSSMEAWQSQMESYDSQQHQFNTMIQQATTELHTARKSIQQLNAKAAKDKQLDTLPEESTMAVPSAAEPVQDAEEKKMRAKMQELIASTAKLATPIESEVIQVEDASPTSGVKRQRSTERPAGTS